LRAAIVPILVTREVMDGEGSWSSPSDGRFNAENIFGHFNAAITHFAPVFSPGVSDDPERSSGIFVFAPTYNGNDMVGEPMKESMIFDDATLVMNQRVGVDGCGNGSSGEYLGLDGVYIMTVSAVLLDGGIGEGGNPNALSASCTGAASIDGGTGGIHVPAKPFKRVVRAGHVGDACLIGHKTSLFDELVHPSMAASIA